MSDVTAAGTVLSVLAASTLGGWGVVVLHWARVPQPPVGTVTSQDGTQVPVLEAGPRHEPVVLRGGTWIGLLERLATTGALLALQPGLLAVVVAVKGLGRWADLRDNPAVTERFIIGTLASLTWAGACGIVGAHLLGGAAAGGAPRGRWARRPQNQLTGALRPRGQKGPPVGRRVHGPAPASGVTGGWGRRRRRLCP